MEVEIKSIKIKVVEDIGDFKNFSFFTTGHVPLLRVKCDSCLNNRIDYAYYYIIDKLEKANLLPENFKMICCDCSYIIEKLGFTKCLDCKSNLGIFADGEKIRIYCYKCKKVHRETKLPIKITDIVDNFVYI